MRQSLDGAYALTKSALSTPARAIASAAVFPGPSLPAMVTTDSGPSFLTDTPAGTADREGSCTGLSCCDLATAPRSTLATQSAARVLDLARPPQWASGRPQEHTTPAPSHRVALCTPLQATCRPLATLNGYDVAPARVAKLVDAADLKFAAARRAGSIPAPRTRPAVPTPAGGRAGVGTVCGARTPERSAAISLNNADGVAPRPDPHRDLVDAYPRPPRSPAACP